MKFTDDNMKHITQVMFNLYSLAKKKKLANVPGTFKEFMVQNINDKLCPSECINYVTRYN
jgi:hypothetical protein